MAGKWETVKMQTLLACHGKAKFFLKKCSPQTSKGCIRATFQTKQLCRAPCPRLKATKTQWPIQMAWLTMLKTMQQVLSSNKTNGVECRSEVVYTMTLMERRWVPNTTIKNRMVRLPFSSRARAVPLIVYMRKLRLRQWRFHHRKAQVATLAIKLKRKGAKVIQLKKHLPRGNKEWRLRSEDLKNWIGLKLSGCKSPSPLQLMKVHNCHRSKSADYRRWKQRKTALMSTTCLKVPQVDQLTQSKF